MSLQYLKKQQQQKKTNLEMKVISCMQLNVKVSFKVVSTL